MVSFLYQLMTAFRCARSAAWSGEPVSARMPITGRIKASTTTAAKAVSARTLFGKHRIARINIRPSYKPLPHAHEYHELLKGAQALE